MRILGKIGFFFAATLLAVSGGDFAHAAEDPYAGLVRIVDVALSQPADVDKLNSAGLVVAHVGNGRATLYVFEEQLATLRALGFAPLATTFDPERDAKNTNGYPTYDEITAELQGYAAEFPDIARLESIGQSVQGRELWVMLITQNPDVKVGKPKFRYISTMHGDEKIGTPLCMYLIDLLLNEYGETPRITSLVNDTEIWIMPIMNPDGWVAHSRFNANGVDLNRNFPSYPNQYSGTIFDESLNVSGKQLETQRVAEWSASHNFVLSANLHSGALVVNYPYDNIPGVPSGTEAPTPDDALVRQISNAYAVHNSPMFNNPSFPGGTVNGSDWYSITGGMQDWFYRYLGCIDLTIELSNTKTPATTTFSQFWSENQESMLSLIEQVHRGVRGTVSDRNTGEPLWVKVNISANDQSVFTDPEVGDYYRLLLPGVYTLHYVAEGYIPYAAAGVEVSSGAATTLDIGLSDGDLNGDGVVNAVDVQISVNALLGYAVGVDADVDGRGLSATDLQHVVNRSLGIF